MINFFPNTTAILTLEMVTDRLKSIKPEFYTQYSIDFMYLGGSWVYKKNYWWSDIDIFISCPNYYGFLPKEKLQFILAVNSEIINHTQLEKIEVQILEVLPLHIQFHIIKDGILIYQSENAKRISFIENLYNNYYDYIIWYENMLKVSLGINNHGNK